MKRKFSQRCRDLMVTAWSAAVQEQLRLWAEELDQQADALERLSAPKVSEPPENVSAKPATQDASAWPKKLVTSASRRVPDDGSILS
jgi:hypothetical protein